MGPSGKFLFEWRAFGEVIINKCVSALTANSVGLQVSLIKNCAKIFCAVNSNILFCKNSCSTFFPSV